MQMRHRLSFGRLAAVGITLTAMLGWSCVRNPPLIAPQPPPPPPPAEASAAPAPVAPDPVPEAPAPVPPAPIPEDAIASRTLEEVNRDAPLAPVFFAYDSNEIDGVGRTVIAANAEVLTQFPTWTVALEGHCDSRGTPEYNLALGDRRARVVRDLLISLGIAPARIQTVSYGEEFPFAPGESEAAWAANRRVHFVVTGQ